MTASLVREQLLQLQREHLVAGYLQLAVEVQLHRHDLRVLEQLVEVVVCHGDRAVRGARTGTRDAQRRRRRAAHVDVPLPAFGPGDGELEPGADRPGVVGVARERTRQTFVEELLNHVVHGDPRWSCVTWWRCTAGSAAAGTASCRSGRARYA